MTSPLHRFKLYFEDLTPSFKRVKVKGSRVTAKATSVNYRQGFWTGWVGDIIKRVRRVCSNRPPIKALKNQLSFKRAVSYKPNWRDVAIALLLGLLLAKSAPTHIIRDQIGGFSPAPAIFSVKPLPLLKEVSYASQESLQPVYVSKLRPTATYANTYDWGNCTFYVASRLPIPNNWGNANNWAYAASLAGYTVSSVPKAGEIAQTTGDSWAGHVAVVESVNPDGSFVISEMNAQGLGVVDSRTTTTAEFPTFIYV